MLAPLLASSCLPSAHGVAVWSRYHSAQRHKDITRTHCQPSSPASRCWCPPTNKMNACDTASVTPPHPSPRPRPTRCQAMQSATSATGAATASASDQAAATTLRAHRSARIVQPCRRASTQLAPAAPPAVAAAQTGEPLCRLCLSLAMALPGLRPLGHVWLQFMIVCCVWQHAAFEWWRAAYTGSSQRQSACSDSAAPPWQTTARLTGDGTRPQQQLQQQQPQKARRDGFTSHAHECTHANTRAHAVCLAPAPARPPRAAAAAPPCSGRACTCHQGWRGAPR